MYGMDHSEVYCENWRPRLSKKSTEGEREIASYVAVQVEYFVAVIYSDGVAPDEPHLEPTD